MILQHRATSIHAITQHDHALYSGAIARAWLHDGDSLALPTVLAVAMHDFAWQPLDRLAGALPFDTAAGLMHDFLSMPSTIKAPLYSAGIDALLEVDRYSAFLVSRHFGSFFSEDYALPAQERARREALLPTLPAALQDEARRERDFRLLQFFDLVSLYACLCCPEALPAHQPAWLRPQLELFEQHYTLSWRGPDHLLLDPFPALQPTLRYSIPYRSLAPGPYPDAASFKQAYRQAPLQHWELSLSAP